MTETTPTRVLLLFGGRSSEHAISCTSAGNVMRALEGSPFEIVPVGITQSGEWVLQEADPDALRIVDGSLPAVAEDGPRVLPPAWPGGQFLRNAGADRWETLGRIDVVFPVLHGPWGEDGTIQGVLELAGIPYVGSGVFASAAGMDKGHSKTLLAAAGIPVGSWVTCHRQDWSDDPERIREQVSELGFPVFVKPCRAGSSVGVSKVSDPADLDAAMATALAEDARLIVEAGVEGARELECGVLVQADGTTGVSVFGEIVVREGHDFYDFEAKYLDDSVDLIVPADLPADAEAELRGLAVRAFHALGCEGLSRVDFFLSAEGHPVLNEVNTMPGFTAISMYPRMWGESGISYPELVTDLITDALRRGTGLR